MQKTLFEDQLEEIFLKNARDIKQPRSTENTLSAHFQISTSQSQHKFVRYFLELHDNLIYCKRNENEKAIAYMDIKNSFMKLTKLMIINGRPHFGIKFVKKNAYEEIFTPDRKVVVEWYNKLKKQCILTRFRNQFRTQKVLGKGSYAKVFLVERISDKKQFAVKVFNKKSIMKDPKELESLLQEIEIMRMIDHEQLMNLYEVYEGENYVYCLCELYRGQSLFQQIVEHGPQSEQKALTIVKQILQGLNYLHTKKFMHRDLKPQNIIFKTEKSIDVGIVDFGFATFEQDYQKIFKNCGTPGYMAPEILEDKNYDSKVDIFSCGVIFYIILTGKVPFGGYTVEEIIENNRKAQINYKTIMEMGVSTQTIDLLKKMLALNPMDRVNSQEALNHSCFQKNLSSSPLVLRQFFQNENLKKHQKITCQLETKKVSTEIPSRIEELSPSPLKTQRSQSPFTQNLDSLNVQQLINN